MSGRSWRRVGACLLVCLLVVTACGRKRAPERTAQLGPPHPSSFSFTGTNTTVAGEDLVVSVGVASVEADFNRDGYKDLAMVESDGAGENEVAIYIRKPERPAERTRVVYYRGGSIRRPLVGKIIGVASRQTAEFADLVVLVAHSNRPNEMIHYHNDGARFEEIPEMDIDAGAYGKEEGGAEGLVDRVRMFMKRLQE